MGNILSVISSRANNSNMDKNSETKKDNVPVFEQNEDDNANSEMSDIERKALREEAMNEFKRELDVKREQRKEILSKHRTEKEQMKQSLASETMAKLELLQRNKALRDLLQKNNIEIPDDLNSNSDDTELVNTLIDMRKELDKLGKNNTMLRRDLVDSNTSLQNAYSDIAELHSQNTEFIKQIGALKEVISISKSLISLREDQLNELKNKLNEIEQSLADREANMLSTDLRQEYERQLQNIRTLRGLYEDRARLAEVTRQGLIRELEDQKALNIVEITKCKELSSKVEELEEQVSKLDDSLEIKKDESYSLRVETERLKAEMLVINKLFSQVLLGYKTEQDLDTLVHRLEEHHGLLTQMAEKDENSETSTALPKLLLELVSQMDEEHKAKDQINNINSEDNNDIEDLEQSTAEKIVQKLPKVWKVLIELLSHQDTENTIEEEKVTTCYKTVETNSGPVLVPSVSKTYIRLKDLIFEKLALIKEVNKMKQLNTHLESRLEEQEKRLCSVTTELSKTWHVVGRLRRHHHQLHTHEKILKYELQQKRKLLNELKEELEYCREKWDLAREKNSQSEKDWKKLRAEFSNRKLKPITFSLNNSAESGYSDERLSDYSSDSNDESSFLNGPLVRHKAKTKSSLEVLDSSTDLNVAEREDPVSDMIDVADLPLDSHEGENHLDKSCIETEDEACEIVNEQETVSSTNAVETINQSDHQSKLTEVLTIDTAAILQSIKIQSARLELKDKKLEKLEKSSADLLKQTRCTVQLSESINSALDAVISRPTLMNQDQPSTSRSSAPETSNQIENNTLPVTSTASPHIDPTAIIESIRKQNERLALKDRRLEKLEDECGGVVKSLSNTIKYGELLGSKLDGVHNNYQEHNKKNTAGSSCSSQKCDDNATAVEKDIEQPSTSKSIDNEIDDKDRRNRENSAEDSEPSTSSEVDHEARFAARDKRLKRLEEQTKSLVNKVNNTTSKGVKIHYKLEELHNIYGSENSRSGTPFDDKDCTDHSREEDSE